MKITSLYLILKFESTVTTYFLRSECIFPNYLYLHLESKQASKQTNIPKSNLSP